MPEKITASKEMLDAAAEAVKAVEKRQTEGVEKEKAEKKEMSLDELREARKQQFEKATKGFTDELLVMDKRIAAGAKAGAEWGWGKLQAVGNFFKEDYKATIDHLNGIKDGVLNKSREIYNNALEAKTSLFNKISNSVEVFLAKRAAHQEAKKEEGILRKEAQARVKERTGLEKGVTGLDSEEQKILVQMEALQRKLTDIKETKQSHGLDIKGLNARLVELRGEILGVKDSLKENLSKVTWSKQEKVQAARKLEYAHTFSN